MRGIIFWVMAISLFSGSSARAAAGDDDKNARSSEKSSPTGDKKPSETAKPGTDPGRNPGGNLGTNPGKPAAANPEVASELKELRQLVQEQAERLRGLQQRLADVEGEVAAGKPGAASAAASATDAVQPATPTASTTASGEGLAVAQPEVPQPAAQETDHKEREKKPSPLYFEIGRAKFTPGGFLDATSFTRTTNLGSGIATSFGAVPFNNTPQGRLSEFRFSAQYSRLSLKVDAPVTDATSLTGYVETDFLGFQPANANITSNSNSLRLRVYWANVKHGKWEVLGGQEWSLMTPNRVGLSPYTGDVFYTYNEDPNFQVGLIWARQAQFRVTYHPTHKLAVAVSAENPQQFAPASVVFPSTTFLTQFDNGSSATNAPSATTNPAVPNLHPDIIVKAAYDTELMRRRFHVEVAGLIRSFRVLNTLVTPNRTDTITGGGGSINLNFQLIKNLTLIANSFYSDGGGRYLGGLGPDAIVKANGNVSAVHSGGGIGGLEWQASRKYMFDAYYGGAYFQRNFGALPTPGSTCNGLAGFSCVGFGFPGSANTTNRAVQEATFDVIPTLWSSEEYGKFQVITQYSYLVRSPWSTQTTPPTPKNAHTSIVYAGIRYTLP
ncbi:MAG: hypothetical protein JWO71_3596 [Candidatus Acidoferrum typicum]|nr:hypothetical protein [Candidatus Acidoferrum typicum]